MAESICSVPECVDKPFGRGLCHIHYSRDWYARNRDRAKAQQSGYREARKAQNRERAAAWRAANPERARENVHRWARENPDRILANKREYRDANREAVYARNKQRRAVKRGAPISDLTAQQWRDIKALYRQRCAYCGRKRPLTQDHVIPLSADGHHTASNVVPACQPCNSAKHVGPPPAYQPLLLE